jgi:hypothetical protein
MANALFCVAVPNLGVAEDLRQLQFTRAECLHWPRRNDPSLIGSRIF